MEIHITDHPNGGKMLSLEGMLNEDSEKSLQNTFENLKNVKKITINFSKIKGINSLGVRVWVVFLRTLEEKREVFFEECTQDIIMQINMIPSFLGKGKITSFFVNYICEKCDKIEKRTIAMKDLKAGEIPSPPQCENDSCDMVTEELEEEYFVFLRR